MPRPGDRSVAAIERVVLAILDSHVAPADGAGRDARTQREVAQRLVKRSRQLRDTADLLIREAEATLAALPEIMRQAPPNVLRLVPRPREAPPGDLRSP